MEFKDMGPEERSQEIMKWCAEFRNVLTAKGVTDSEFRDVACVIYASIAVAQGCLPATIINGLRDTIIAIRKQMDQNNPRIKL